MAIEDTRHEEPQEQPEAQEQPQEQAPQESGLSKALEQITRLRQEQNQYNQYMAHQLAQRQQQQATPVEDEDDDEDLDPAVKKHLAKLERRFTEQYQRDQQMLLGETQTRAADLERERLLNDLRRAGREEDIRLVDQYMDDRQVPLHLRATRDSWRAAYHNILGERQAQELLRRPAPTAAPSRAAQEPEEGPRLSELDLAQAERINRAFGVQVDEDEAKIFDNNHVSIADYKNHLMAKMAKENKG